MLYNKPLLVYLLLLLPAVPCLSQQQNKLLAVVKVNNRFGCIDTAGKVVIAARYATAPAFSQGLAYIINDSTKGYINTSGQQVLQFNTSSSPRGNFSEGLALVQRLLSYEPTVSPVYPTHGDPVTPAQQEKKGIDVQGKDMSYGFINMEGKTVVPASFDHAFDFSEGMARVNMGGEMKNTDSLGPIRVQGGSWGFIDHTGKMVIPLGLEDARDFSCGLAAVKVKGKYGFVNKSGELVVPAVYDAVSDFRDQVAIVEADKVFYMLEQQGRPFKENTLDITGYYSHSEGLWSVALKNGKRAFINNKGKIILTLDPQSGIEFHEGLLCAAKNGKWGYVDRNGKWIIEPSFDYVLDFSNGLAPAYMNGKWGYIDRSGKWKIAPAFEYAGEFMRVD